MALHPSVVGRYHVVRELSTHQESRVFLAQDVGRGGSTCVLKILRVEGARGYEIARREYETLRKLRHPGIAEVYDFGRLESNEFEHLGGRLDPVGGVESFTGQDIPGALAYLTSVYYEGLNLREAFLRLFPRAGASGAGSPRSRRSGSTTATATRNSWRTFLKALSELCQALDVVHRHGIIHYDIKPENLLLIPDRNNGRPSAFETKLLDFGLSEEETTPLATSIQGTIPYIAPEIIESDTADRRSDLFSLGVSIAYAISGRYPFAGSSPREWLESAARNRILSVSELCADAPTGLSDLVTCLVQSDPSARPPDALTVQSSLEKIGGFTLPASRSHHGTPIPTVGWEEELGHLRTELEQLERGDAEKTLLVFEGDSGQFMEAFVEEVEATARSEGAALYSGRCRLPRRYPYQPFAEIILQLAYDVDLSAPRFHQFGAVLSRIAPISLPAQEPLPRLSLRDGSTRFLGLLTEFFLEVARERPLVLSIRDLQLAGHETLQLIRSLMRNCASGELQDEGRRDPPSFRPARLLVVASLTEAEQEREGQREAADASSTMRELFTDAASSHRRLENLGLDRVAEWIKGRAPQLELPPALIRKFHSVSGGAPRLLDEFVRRLSAGDGTADGGILDLPRKPDESALERINSVSGEAREILEILAVSHGPLAQSELQEVLRSEESRRAEAGPPTAAVTSALWRELEDEGLITRTRGMLGEELGISFGDVAEEVYRSVAESRRQSIHRRLATALMDAARGGAPCRVPEDVGLHARLAGWQTLYFDQALLASERLCRAHAYEGATRLYEEVLERVANLSVPQSIDEEPPAESAFTDPDALRRTVTEKLAGIYFGSKQSQRALEKLTLLSSLYDRSTTRLELADTYRRMGEIYYENAELANSLFFLEKGLDTVRGRADGTPPRSTASPQEVGEPIKEGHRRVADSPIDGTEVELRILLALARSQLDRDDLSRTRMTLTDCLKLADEGYRYERCHALLLLADLEDRSGSRDAALHHHQVAIECCHEENDLALSAEVLGAVSNYYMERGEYDEAIELLEERLQIARALHSKPAMGSSYMILGTTYHNRGDHQRALDCYRNSLRLHHEIGNLHGIADSYNNLGLVHQLKDDLVQARDCFTRAIGLYSRINDQFGMARGMLNLSAILELEGEYNEALDYAFRALDKRKKSRSPAAIAFSYYRIGRIYQSKGELDKALTYAVKSLRIRSRMDARLWTAHSHLQLAQIHLAQGKLYDSFDLCRQAYRSFQSLKNNIGKLLAKEIYARLCMAIGRIDGAERTLLTVLTDARKLQQPVLVGSCLSQLAQISLERGEDYRAETELEEAESLFRTASSQRELASVLLDRSSLELNSGHVRKAEALLEEAYVILEKLGTKDLVPIYFLLKGRSELTRHTPESMDLGRKHLGRGLVESRELKLPELRWRFHYQLALAEHEDGDLRSGEIQREQAREVLEEMLVDLPPSFQSRFFETRERRRVVEPLRAARQESAQAAASGPPDAPGPAEAEAEQDTLFRKAFQTLHREALKLHEVAGLLGSESDLERLLERILDAVLELVDAEKGFIFLNGEDGARNLTVARNIDREHIPEPEQLVSGSVAEEVLRSGRPVLIKNAIDDEKFKEAESIRKLRLRSLVCVPLRFRGSVLGVIYLDNRHRRDAFKPVNLDALQAFADQAAVAVTNARLLEESRLRAEELEVANQQLDTHNLKLRQKVHRQTAQLALAQADLRSQQEELERRYRFENIIGRSRPMQLIYHLLERISATDLPVLIEGDSGTGKELIARAIHYNSLHKHGRFVSESCGALSDSLLETELFGHVKGAFTGAEEDKKGLFEQAHQGTLFLDSVGEMSPQMQQKLLRVLEEGEVRPVGAKSRIKVNVRVVCASSQDLRTLVAERVFREDLYYRLNGIRIPVPALRERKEDIPLLVASFCEEIAAGSGAEPPEFLEDAIAALVQHDWPGNVRELRGVLEKTLLIASKTKIGRDDLVFDHVMAPQDRLTLKEARDRFEHEFLRECLQRSADNVAQAARLCDVSRETFYRLLRKHELTPRRGAREGS